jgi:hypothetical protein
MRPKEGNYRTPALPSQSLNQGIEGCCRDKELRNRGKNERAAFYDDPPSKGLPAWPGSSSESVQVFYQMKRIE